MFALVALLLVVQVVIPLAMAWRLLRLNAPSLAAALATAAEATALSAFVITVGRWDIAGLHTRTAVTGLLGLAPAVSFIRHARRPLLPGGAAALWRGWWTTLVPAFAFAVALGYLATGFVPPEPPRDLAFPLKGGRFVVAQGGAGGLLNRHAGHAEQRYAVDITAVGPEGFRAAGLLPADPGAYRVFGTPVLAPCAGTVETAWGDLPDLPPPTADRAAPEGNHVVLRCGDLDVEVAHLAKGSVAVVPGAAVEVGDLLGRVGNSGNTTEPHLHVHATLAATNTGVPVSFDGRFPVRGQLYVQ